MKNKVFNQCCSSNTNGCQIWTFSKKNLDKVTKTQRPMLGIRLTDRNRNTGIRGVIKVENVTQKFARLKWSFAGYVV